VGKGAERAVPTPILHRAKARAMRVEPVEIYSDAGNNAVMRHPDRRFPGVLVQGDSLYSMCRTVDEICSKARERLDHETYESLNDLRKDLWARLNHYKIVLSNHNISLPFSEI
jgi:hypothetical protein